MKRFLRAAGLCLLILLSPGLASFTAADDPVTNLVLGGVEDKVDDVIGRAEAAGNSFIANFAKQAKDLIKAWKEANSALLDQGFDRLDASTQTMFNEMDRTMTRLEANEQVVNDDLETLTAEWSGIIKNLPFTNHVAEVFSYSPRVILPVGQPILLLKILGPKLSSYHPTITAEGVSVAVGKTAEQELTIQLDRNKLHFDPKNSGYAIYKLHLSEHEDSLMNPSSWGQDIIERDIILLLLPQTLAHLRIVPQIKDPTFEHDTFSASVGGKGRDSPYDVGVPIPPDLKAQGWLIDMDKLVNDPGPWIADMGGDNGSCSNLLRNTLTPEAFTFRMTLGHRSRRRDAWVNCRLTVPIVRDTTVARDGGPIEDDLNWTDDKVINLPTNTVSYRLTIWMFDGKRYEVTDKSKVPYGFIDIENLDKAIRFSARPPHDF